MGKFTVEQIDYLREKASITYEEALETLERCEGDLARCLVDLERKGRIKPQRKAAGAENNYRFEYRFDRDSKPYKNYWNEKRANEKQHHERAFVLDMESFKQFIFSHIVVRSGERIVADLPVVFYIFALFFGFPVFMTSLVMIVLLGYRVKWERRKEKPGRMTDIYDFVDKTAENIRRTADNIAHAVKQEIKPKRDEGTSSAAEEAPETAGADEDDDAGEGDSASEFTVE